MSLELTSHFLRSSILTHDAIKGVGKPRALSRGHAPAGRRGGKQGLAGRAGVVAQR
jgi:hypothetical protein